MRSEERAAASQSSLDSTAEHHLIAIPAELPIQLGDAGDAVADVRRRLYLAGCEVSDSENREFTQLTQEAVFLFQATEGLPETGQVDHATWSGADRSQPLTR